MLETLPGSSDRQRLFFSNTVIEKAVTKCAQYWPIGEANGDHDSYLFEETGYRVTLLEKEDKYNFVVSR